MAQDDPSKTAGPPATPPTPAASLAEPGLATPAATEPSEPVDPASLVLITNPSLPGGAVTTVPRRAFDDLWSEKGFVLVDSDADVVASTSGQIFLKDSATEKYQPVPQDGVKAGTAHIANHTEVTPGPVLPGSRG